MDNTKSNNNRNSKNVEATNEDHLNKDFPGYPHYPASEDITNPQNNTARVSTSDVENVTREDLRHEPINKNSASADPQAIEGFDDLGIVPGTEADVTEEDLRNLGPKDKDLDMGEDETIEAAPSPETFGDGTEETVDDLSKADLADEMERTGYDLDVPTPDDDTNKEDALGQDDEENDYYSLGGDEMNNLDEDPTAEGF